MASSYQLVNKALNGGLPAELGRMRAEGLTLEQMADDFAARGFDVSLETVRRWCHQAGVPTNRVPAVNPPPAGAESTDRGDSGDSPPSAAPVGGQVEELAS